MKPYICKTHGAVEPYEYRTKAGDVGRWCRECRRARSAKAARRASHKEWFSSHPDYYVKWQQKYRARVRADVLAAYGGACACCGLNEPAFLTIDHTKNDGKKHRAQNKNGWLSIYDWLWKNGCPKDGYELACFNCNLGRAKNKGICPHKETPHLVPPLEEVKR